MSKKRKIEIYSAGCPLCVAAVEQVERIACSSCDIEVLDLNEPQVAARAQELGINRVPAVLIDGKLAECCATSAVNESVLCAAGVGVPLS
jgi:glutaredoxin 3